MGTVDLDDRLNNPLFYTFHSIKFLIQDTTCFLGINRLKVIMFPLNVHHDGKCSLSMTSFLLGNLMGAGNCQVSSRPETDIIRHGLSGTGHKVGDTLNAGELHVITVFFLLIVLIYFCRCTACKETLDHELKKSILCRKLGTAAKSDLTDLVNGISLFCILSGKTDVDMIFSEPFDQACKTRIDLQDICRKNTVLFLELKCSLLCRIGKISAGMMFPLSFAVIQDQHWFLRCGFCLIGTKCCICALALCLIFVCRCCAEIKNWHIFYSSFSEKYLL